MSETKLHVLAAEAAQQALSAECDPVPSSSDTSSSTISKTKPDSGNTELLLKLLKFAPLSYGDFFSHDLIVSVRAQIQSDSGTGSLRQDQAGRSIVFITGSDPEGL